VFSDFSGGLGGLGGQPGVVSSGAADGNYPGAGGSIAGLGMPNLGNGAVIVGLIVIFAVILLIAGVISLRAAGEVVI